MALLVFGYLILGGVWALSNPVPSGTDEPAHYIKALATGQGDNPRAISKFGTQRAFCHKLGSVCELVVEDHEGAEKFA